MDHIITIGERARTTERRSSSTQVKSLSYPAGSDLEMFPLPPMTPGSLQILAANPGDRPVESNIQKVIS